MFESVPGGHVHLSVARRKLDYSHWVEDIRELDYEGLCGAGLDTLRIARDMFREDMRLKGIKTNEQLFDYLGEQIYKIRLREAEIRKLRKEAEALR